MPSRVAIVAGLRTPFVKSGGPFAQLSALDLGRIVVAELLQRAEVRPEHVDQVVYGQVVPSILAPNIARELVLSSGMSKATVASSVSFACATSIKAMTDAAQSLALGHGEVAVVGGAECLSDVPIVYAKPLAQAVVAASRAKSFQQKLGAFSRVQGKDLLPNPPALAEPTTGLTMGESAEKMAKENGISREAQDELAHRSHVNAARAWAEGKYAAEVMTVHVPPKFDKHVHEDNIVRKDSELSSYAALKPAFDRRYGTITAGNSSPLTDGASALLLMTEERAKAEGRTPLGYLKSYAYAAVDPGWQLLQAPPFAVPRALKAAGVTLQEVDLVDMHEAFAAQVLSNLQAFASQRFYDERMPGTTAPGEVDPAKLNVNGGSIALGHPFAATGARMVLSTLNELRRRNGRHALLTVCAAGGLGAAVVLERA